MLRVKTAEPYRYRASHYSHSKPANNMLICQHNFPDTYDERDMLLNDNTADLFVQDFNRVANCFKRHLGSSDIELEHWAHRVNSHSILNFLKDILQADVIEWTGYRILCTVSTYDGYPIWILQLFAKHPSTSTRTYSDENGPNVLAPERISEQTVYGIHVN